MHHLTGETVMVALSSVNSPSLASLARQKHPACQIVLAADRDLSGDGQKKAAAAADACEGVVACRRRSSVTGMMPSRSTAGKPPVRPFMMPSGHRLKARSTP
ncbi:hypothetical protein CF60_22015 [Escherichia coli]|nr:hypothetical protein CF60_22015 [Escherichia coli]